MRKFIYASGILLAGILFLGGCKKSEEPVAGTPPPLTLNATTFRPAFESAAPELKAVVDQVMMNIQGSMYPQALKDLAKLGANPALTEAQKKAVSDLTDQLNKKMAAMQQLPK